MPCFLPFWVFVNLAFRSSPIRPAINAINVMSLSTKLKKAHQCSRVKTWDMIDVKIGDMTL